MSKKIELKRIAPAERADYPELKSKSELKKMKLMPAYNVKPRALVIRRLYGNYLLYDVNKTIPYRESNKEKARRKSEKARRIKESTCRACKTKFDYYDIVNDYIPFVREKRLCSSCYYKQFRKYKNGIVYDLETTGFSPHGGDEVLSMCIMDLRGNILFEHLFKPQKLKAWDEAAAVNGITPEMVANEKPISYYKEDIQEIISGADIVVTYNGTGFDNAFLLEAGLDFPAVPQFDVMYEFAWLMHQWDTHRKDWRWYSLEFCAGHYDFQYKAHDVVEDTRATLHCYRELIGSTKGGL